LHTRQRRDALGDAFGRAHGARKYVGEPIALVVDACGLFKRFERRQRTDEHRHA
jgi:hypothetical protein